MNISTISAKLAALEKVRARHHGNSDPMLRQMRLRYLFDSAVRKAESGESLTHREHRVLQLMHAAITREAQLA